MSKVYLLLLWNDYLIEVHKNFHCHHNRICAGNWFHIGQCHRWTRILHLQIQEVINHPGLDGYFYVVRTKLCNCVTKYRKTTIMYQRPNTTIFFFSGFVCFLCKSNTYFILNVVNTTNDNILVYMKYNLNVESFKTLNSHTRFFHHDPSLILILFSDTKLFRVFT